MPGLQAFAGRNRGDDQGDERVCPGPADGGVEQQPGEQDRGQVSADLGLGGVGADGRRAELAATLRLARTSSGITSREATARAIPTGLGSAWPSLSRLRTVSTPT